MASPDFLISITVMSRSASWATLWKFWVRPFRGKCFALYRVKLCANSKKVMRIVNLKIVRLCSRSLYCKASIIYSDDQTEFQIKDRLSFMHFLGLDFEDTVPDAKTLWLYPDTLSNKNAIDKLFRRLNRYLDHEGLFARQGQLIDASIIPVPVQRNTREENTRIKQDDVPEDWKEQPHKLQ
jgi:hypothetical protein